MKRIFITIMLIAGLAGIDANAQNHDWANFGKYEQKNTEVSIRPKAVFMGDSITEGWMKKDASFFTDNNFLCRGISGQTTSQMLVRFRRDVIDLSPKYVVILAGTNDIARNNGYIALENIVGNVMSMCELAKLHGIKPIVCSIIPADRYEWRMEVSPIEPIRKVNAMLKEYAKSAKIPYVDYYSVLATDTGSISASHAPDGVHPNHDCLKIMESIILPYIR